MTPSPKRSDRRMSAQRSPSNKHDRKRFAERIAPLAAALLSACSAAGPPVFARGPDDPDPPRHPDGVAIDPVTAPPPARHRARADDGLVTLRTPLGIDVAVATVEQLFRKIVREDAEGLEA